MVLSTNTYPYHAYIERQLSNGDDAKETQLWHKDTASRMDAVAIIAGDMANASFVTRRDEIIGSRVVDTMGRLHVDLFLQDKFIINGVRSKYDWYAKERVPTNSHCHHQSHFVRKEGHAESVHLDGAHQSPREVHGQVSDAPHRV